VDLQVVLQRLSAQEERYEALFGDMSATVSALETRVSDLEDGLAKRVDGVEVDLEKSTGKHEGRMMSLESRIGGVERGLEKKGSTVQDMRELRKGMVSKLDKLEYKVNHSASRSEASAIRNSITIMAMKIADLKNEVARVAEQASAGSESNGGRRAAGQTEMVKKRKVPPPADGKAMDNDDMWALMEVRVSCLEEALIKSSHNVIEKLTGKKNATDK